MKKASKLALAALTLSLVPFEIKSGENGEFSCQSVLIGFSKGKIQDGKQNLTLSLFNLPGFLKKKPEEKPKDIQTGEEPAAAPEAPM